VGSLEGVASSRALGSKRELPGVVMFSSMNPLRILSDPGGKVVRFIRRRLRDPGGSLVFSGMVPGCMDLMEMSSGTECRPNREDPCHTGHGRFRFEEDRLRRRESLWWNLGVDAFLPVDCRPDPYNKSRWKGYAGKYGDLGYTLLSDCLGRISVEDATWLAIVLFADDELSVVLNVRQVADESLSFLVKFVLICSP